MNLDNDEDKKIQEQKITIRLRIDDNIPFIFTDVTEADIHRAIEERQRQQKLQVALEASGTAHLDGYNPYLN